MKRSKMVVLTLFFVISGLFCFPQMGLAVPSLGVATEYGYVTGGSLEAYQSYFGGSVTPYNMNEGFVIGPSGSDLIIFTNITNADIFLLTTANVESSANPSFNGQGLNEIPTTGGQFNGYLPLPYFGRNLGPVNTSDGWYLLPSSPFQPSPFYALNVTLTYGDGLDADSWFFAVADSNGTDGLNTSRRPDPFSPYTTSAGRYGVPEPGTLIMLGIGLVGIAGWGRKRIRM